MWSGISSDNNAYHKVALTQNSDVMKKYPAGKNTIFNSVWQKIVWIASCCCPRASEMNIWENQIFALWARDKVQRSQTLWFPKITRDKLLSGSITQKYFIEGARKIFHSVVTTCPLLSTWALRDSKGISKLSLIQLILPNKISCNRGSSDIPLLSLGHSVIRDQNYPQSISCAQRAATGCSVCY